MATRIDTAQTPAEMARAESQSHMELAATSGSVLFTRQDIAMQAEVGALIVWVGTSDRPRAAAEATSRRDRNRRSGINTKWARSSTTT